ncbi:MAG: imidazoleglycerol-phosphate dehydratase HisB [Acidiphilium sp.]
MSRTATISRKTSETSIELLVDLDGAGRTDIGTGIGFFDHMLTAFGRHAMLDLDIHAEGDLHIDAHHTVEDIGIVLGQAIREALGDKRGVARFGHAAVPMDEALCEASIDVSGRGFLVFDVAFERPMLGDMDTQLVQEFFQALASNAGFTLHLTRRAGHNAHHVAEAAFKAAARALRMAVEPDPRAEGAIPSTKGVL